MMLLLQSQSKATANRETDVRNRTTYNHYFGALKVKWIAVQMLLDELRMRADEIARGDGEDYGESNKLDEDNEKLPF